MKTLDPRIRHEHIARYGATDEIGDYLRTLEGLLSYVVPVGYVAQNHHMLARCIWPEYSSLAANPWNRLRVSYKIHAALTELQSRFEERLQFAMLYMKGKTAEAFLETRRQGGRIGGRIGGKISGRRSVESGLLARITTPESRSKGGKIAGKIAGRKAVESGRWASIQAKGRETYQRAKNNRGLIIRKMPKSITSSDAAAQLGLSLDIPNERRTFNRSMRGAGFRYGFKYSGTAKIWGRL